MSDIIKPETPAEIIPGAVPDSLIPGFRCRSNAPSQKFLFVGGPADGQKIPVPPDGRHYYWRPEDEDGDEFGEAWIYVPAVIRFKAGITPVYLFDEHIKAAETDAVGIEGPVQQRIGKQRRIEG